MALPPSLPSDLRFNLALPPYLTTYSAKGGGGISCAFRHCFICHEFPLSFHCNTTEEEGRGRRVVGGAFQRNFISSSQQREEECEYTKTPLRFGTLLLPNSRLHT